MELGIQNRLLVLILLLLPSLLAADGKMYSKYAFEEVNPEIPYQRALIIYDEGQETLILQSKYSLDIDYSDNVSDIADLAWVVPVPSVPELASMPAHDASSLFLRINSRSRTHVTVIWEYVFRILYLPLLFMSVIVLVRVIATRNEPDSWFYKHRSVLTHIFAPMLMLLLFPFVFLPTLGKAKGGPGVELLDSQSVGMYDVKVIKSDSADSIVSWLSENGFTYGDSDIKAFDYYVEKIWCFVVAKVNPHFKGKQELVMMEGLPSPLILRFASEAPVYPMVLTGAGGFDTEVLVYLIAAEKMTCSELELKYASDSKEFPVSFERLEFEPAEFFSGKCKDDISWLMKFKAVLTPKQMTEDIIFSPADNSNEYREHIVKWW